MAVLYKARVNRCYKASLGFSSLCFALESGQKSWGNTLPDLGQIKVLTQIFMRIFVSALLPALFQKTGSHHIAVCSCWYLNSSPPVNLASWPFLVLVERWILLYQSKTALRQVTEFLVIAAKGGHGLVGWM